MIINYYHVTLQTIIAITDNYYFLNPGIFPHQVPHLFRLW